MSRFSLRDGLPFFWAALLFSLGCGSSAKPQSPEERNLKALAVLVGKHRNANKGAAPASLDALKAFVKKADAKMLQSLDIEAGSVDAMFDSTRDKKPFVYRPSKGGGAPVMGSDGQPVKVVVLHEAEGVGGRRWVAYDLGGTELVDQAKFKQLVSEAP